MIAEAKLIVAPLFAVGIVSSNFLASLPDAFRVSLDVAALGILLAGFLVLGKLRAQTAAAEGSANAWRSERDAMAEKVDRTLKDLALAREETASLRTLNIELQSRPTIDGLVAQIEELRKSIHELATNLPNKL